MQVNRVISPGEAEQQGVAWLFPPDQSNQPCRRAPQGSGHAGRAAAEALLPACSHSPSPTGLWGPGPCRGIAWQPGQCSLSPALRGRSCRAPARAPGSEASGAWPCLLPASLIPRPVAALPVGLLTPSPHCHQPLRCSAFSPSALTQPALPLPLLPLGPSPRRCFPPAVPAPPPPPAPSLPLRDEGGTATPRCHPQAAGRRPARCRAPLRPAPGPGRAHLGEAAGRQRRRTGTPGCPPPLPAPRDGGPAAAVAGGPRRGRRGGGGGEGEGRRQRAGEGAAGPLGPARAMVTAAGAGGAQAAAGCWGRRGPGAARPPRQKPCLSRSGPGGSVRCREGTLWVSAGGVAQ